MATNSPRGVFLNTTFDIDVASIDSIEVDSAEFKELLIRLYQNLNVMVLSLNLKETGQYWLKQPFITGAQWFANPALNSSTTATPVLRAEQRMVYLWPAALPNIGSASIAHNIPITTNTTFTFIGGTANDTADNLYIALNDGRSQITVDATNITITTSVDLSAYNITYVILKFLQS